MLLLFIQHACESLLHLLMTISGYISCHMRRNKPIMKHIHTSVLSWTHDSLCTSTLDRRIEPAVLQGGIFALFGTPKTEAVLTVNDVVYSVL